MIDELQPLLDNNRAWADIMIARDPDYFARLAQQQRPRYLWLGCSDARVPANEVTGLHPGDIFVHRNVANLVNHADLNCLSVLQFAIEVLEIRHIIVCGHTQCGGVRASLQHSEYGLIDNWLRNLRDIHYHHRAEFDTLDETAQIDLLCELNVVEQVANVCHTTIVQRAWHKGQPLAVHGWLYNIHSGQVRDLHVSVASMEQIPPIYRIAQMKRL